MTQMVDKAKCDQMLSNLQQYTASLQRLAGVAKGDFLANPDQVASAKDHFIIAIEVCIDLANHMISSERYRVPHDNGDSFAVLIENGILPEEKRPAYMAMAQFRNRLVHLYWDVDDALVREYLETRLSDFRSFSKNVSDFLWAALDDAGGEAD
jgi:uncharacterized protein YutE (UPF0331/DUF86 family)